MLIACIYINVNAYYNIIAYKACEYYFLSISETNLYLMKR